MFRVMASVDDFPHLAVRQRPQDAWRPKAVDSRLPARQETDIALRSHECLFQDHRNGLGIRKSTSMLASARDLNASSRASVKFEVADRDHGEGDRQRCDPTMQALRPLLGGHRRIGRERSQPLRATVIDSTSSRRTTVGIPSSANNGRCSLNSS